MVLINQIKREHPLKKRKRVGRGGKRGTYSGRGKKGQKARSGRKIKSQLREFLLRIPQKRGTGFNIKPSSKESFSEVSLGLINEHYKSGEMVTPRTLLKKGIIEKRFNKLPAVKILAKGQLRKRLSFFNVEVSESARQQIEKLGGTIKQTIKQK